MTPFGDGLLDLPFEPTPPGMTLPAADMAIAGGVVYLAAVIPLPGRPHTPGIVFRFARPDGTFMQPILLILDETRMAQVPDRIEEVVAAAINGAQEANHG